MEKTKTVVIPKYAKRLLLLGCLVVLMSESLLCLRAQSDKLACEITKVEEQLEIAKTEHTRLKAEYNAKVSSDKIEEYAREKLGMQKAESYQIIYIDMSEGDKILVSGDKSVTEENELLEACKEFFNPKNW